MLAGQKTAEERRFAWALSQGQIDLLAAVLYRAENTFRAVDPYNLSAERANELLTEMREQTCQAGAEDPFPFLPMRCGRPDRVVAA